MIYLDANVTIRYLEGAFAIRQLVQQRLESERWIVTSQLSRLECRCHPIREKKPELLAIYDDFLVLGIQE